MASGAGTGAGWVSIRGWGAGWLGTGRGTTTGGSTMVVVDFPSRVVVVSAGLHEARTTARRGNAMRRLFMRWGVNHEKIVPRWAARKPLLPAALFGRRVGHGAAGLAQVAAHADQCVARAEEAAGKEQ